MKNEKLKKLLDNKEIEYKSIIDIRESYEVKTGTIKGSTNIPMNKLLKNPSKYLKKDQTYYLMCLSGARSFSAWINLRLKGYSVKNISGGYLRWKQINI